jgi:RNA binding exosome subunit
MSNEVTKEYLEGYLGPKLESLNKEVKEQGESIKKAVLESEPEIEIITDDGCDDLDEIKNLFIKHQILKLQADMYLVKQILDID